LNSRSDVILSHKKFTWANFFFFWGGGGINTDIHPVAMSLVVVVVVAVAVAVAVV